MMSIDVINTSHTAEITNSFQDISGLKICAHPLTMQV